MFKIFSISFPVLLITCATASLASMAPPSSHTVVEKRFNKEDLISADRFAITAYKQNYILPFYYTASPYNSVYQNMTPNNEHIKSSEIKYQLSLKVPIWKDIFNTRTSLFLAYTQLSYWQAYSKTAFFRETDYQPEVFLRKELSLPLLGQWEMNSLSLGATHESNGFGDALERSWNRVYLQATAANSNWMLSLRPWYVLKDSIYNQYNPNMAKYLGYGEVIVAYQCGQQTIAIQGHGLVEQAGKHATALVTWSFPLTSYLNGYVQVFSGYGQSLIEYDHRTNSAGVGISFSDFI